ncbi:MAG: hypothetical protein JSV33_01370 [bacterium]|nr:MAG: hypothetical protein JSV33_01370 [bacterium]
MEEKEKQSTAVPAGIAGLLTYFIPFFGGLLFLFLEKENKLVRFHAVQSILLWIFFIVISVIFAWIPVINILLYLFVLIVWIFIMYQALMEKMYELPVIGKYARRQVLGTEEHAEEEQKEEK